VLAWGEGEGGADWAERACVCRVRVYRWRDAAPLAVLRCHTESVYALDWSGDMGTLASGGKDGRVALWALYPPRSDVEET
jgi:WD40 repeat protein